MGRPKHLAFELERLIVIEVRSLFKYYGKRKAVGPLSFSIAQGEIVGLLGLNGAGKTTTLRVLSCDLLPSSGTVVVDGHDVVDHPDEVRRRVGYLPDSPPLYGEMRVHDYLIFAARLRGLRSSEAESRAREVEKATGIQDVSDELIHSLSHGYKQRVGIAQAIVHRPRLLLLDEPILGLDPMQIVGMRQLLRNLKGDYTIVLSSHILSEISETCDRLLVIRNGEIVASGTEAELSTRLLRGQRVEITVHDNAEKAEALLRSAPGVKSVDRVSSPDIAPGDMTYHVEAETDCRAALVRALVEAHVGVVGLSRGEHELESIFMRLAGGETGPSMRAPGTTESSSASPSSNVPSNKQNAAAKAS